MRPTDTRTNREASRLATTAASTVTCRFCRKPFRSIGMGDSPAEHDWIACSERTADAAHDTLAVLTELVEALAVVDRGWNDGNVTVLQQAMDKKLFDRALAAIAKAEAVGDRTEPTTTAAEA